MRGTVNEIVSKAKKIPLLKKVFGAGFIGDSAIYLAISAIINVLNYVFILIVVHCLSKEAFGRFNTIIAAVTVCSVFANSIQMHVARRIGILPTVGLAGYLREVMLRSLKWVGFGAILCVLAVPFLDSFLGLPKSESLLGYLVFAGFVFSALGNAMTSGFSAMKIQVVYNLYGTVSKLVIGGLLMWLGFEVGGALLGYLAGLLLVYFLSRWCLQTLMDRRRLDGGIEESKGSVMLLALMYFLLVLPFGFDQIIVQALSREFSGDYGALAVVGKIVFYVSSPVLTVLYSHLVNSQNNRKRQLQLIGAAALGCLVIAGIAVSIMVAFRSGVISAMLPARYFVLAPLVPMFGFAMLCYSLSYIVVSDSIVRMDKMVLIPLLLGAITQIVLFYLRREGLELLVSNQFYTCIVQFMLVGLYFCLSKDGLPALIRVCRTK